MENMRQLLSLNEPLIRTHSIIIKLLIFPLCYYIRNDVIIYVFVISCNHVLSHTRGHTMPIQHFVSEEHTKSVYKMKQVPY